MPAPRDARGYFFRGGSPPIDTRLLFTVFALTSLALLGLGLATSSWWPLAGGVSAAAAAAWLITEEEDSWPSS